MNNNMYIYNLSWESYKLIIIMNKCIIIITIMHVFMNDVLVGFNGVKL